MWLTIPLAPILSFIILVVFSLIIEMLEPNEKVKPTTIPTPKNRSDFILSMKPDGLLCPSCGSDKIMEILYGLPVITQQTQKELKQKAITLGGCMVDDNAPLWMCEVCNYKFDHPVNKDQALKIVQDIIKNWDLPEGDHYIVVESGTIEKEWGWVFFHTSKKFFETKDIKYAVAGNAPFIVLRKNGRVIVTGTAYPIEHYIKRFEETGDPHS